MGVLLILTGHALQMSLLVLTLASFASMVACLYVATLLVGYKLTVKQILAIALICSILGAVPVVGWLLSFAVGFGLIMSFTSAEWLDTLFILIVNSVLRFAVEWVVVIAFGLQFGLFHR